MARGSVCERGEDAEIGGNIVYLCKVCRVPMFQGRKRGKVVAVKLEGDARSKDVGSYSSYHLDTQACRYRFTATNDHECRVGPRDLYVFGRNWCVET